MCFQRRPVYPQKLLGRCLSLHILLGFLLEYAEQNKTTELKVWACLCRGSCPPHTLPTPSPNPWCFGSSGVESFAHFGFLHFFLWVCVVCPALSQGVPVAIPAVESQHGETCACSYRPVLGKLVILDMEIVKTKWEARSSYFHAATQAVFLVESWTTGTPFAWLAHLATLDTSVRSIGFTD